MESSTSACSPDPALPSLPCLIFYLPLSSPRTYSKHNPAPPPSSSPSPQQLHHHRVHRVPPCPTVPCRITARVPDRSLSVIPRVVHSLGRRRKSWKARIAGNISRRSRNRDGKDTAASNEASSSATTKASINAKKGRTMRGLIPSTKRGTSPADCRPHAASSPYPGILSKRSKSEPAMEPAAAPPPQREAQMSASSDGVNRGPHAQLSPARPKIPYV